MLPSRFWDLQGTAFVVAHHDLMVPESIECLHQLGPPELSRP
jgi:hypothetical protein